MATKRHIPNSQQLVKRGQVYLDLSNPPYKQLWVVTECTEDDKICLLSLDGTGHVADVDTHSFRVQRWSKELIQMSALTMGQDEVTLYFTWV